jgi:hypothetical protein
VKEFLVTFDNVAHLTQDLTGLALQEFLEPQMGANKDQAKMGWQNISNLYRDEERRFMFSLSNFCSFVPPKAEIILP